MGLTSEMLLSIPRGLRFGECNAPSTPIEKQTVEHYQCGSNVSLHSPGEVQYDHSTTFWRIITWIANGCHFFSPEPLVSSY